MPCQQSQRVVTDRGTRTEKDRRYSLEGDRVPTPLQRVVPGGLFRLSFEGQRAVPGGQRSPCEPQQPIPVGVRNPGRVESEAPQQHWIRSPLLFGACPTTRRSGNQHPVSIRPMPTHPATQFLRELLWVLNHTLAPKRRVRSLRSPSFTTPGPRPTEIDQAATICLHFRRTIETFRQPPRVDGFPGYPFTCSQRLWTPPAVG